jgi:DNA invertase Pin-like site-specific DNA recombinase
MSKQLIGYIRVSTEEQGKSGHGLDAQRVAIRRFAHEKGYNLIDIVEEVASGADGLEHRHKLADAIKRAKKLKAHIVVSKLDRLSRDATFILNLMQTKAQFIVVQLGEDVDTFMLHIYAVLGEQERFMIGQRTRDALSRLVAKGVKLGNPNREDRLDENGNVVYGQLTAMKKARERLTSKADTFAERMYPTIINMMAVQGMSMNAIARDFNEKGVKTARGGEWTAKTVSNIIERMENVQPK